MQVLKKIIALALALTLTLSIGAVTVLAEDKAGIPLLTLSTTNLKLSVGESATIKVLTPGVSSVEWTMMQYSSDYAKFEESDNGMEITVTAIVPNSLIHLTARSHGYYYTDCYIRILSEADETNHEINIVERSIQCELGTTATLNVNLIGSPNVYCQLENSFIGSIQNDNEFNSDSQVNIKANQVGVTIITAENQDRSLFDQCRFEVVPPGEMYYLPGESIGLDSGCFQKKSDRTPMPELLNGEFNTDYFDVTSKKILKGASLVNEVEINDNYCDLRVYLNDNYSLLCPIEPNLVFDSIEVTAKKSLKDKFVKGDIFVLSPNVLMYRVGYSQQNQAIDIEHFEYIPEVMTNFVENNGIKSGTANYHTYNLSFHLEGEVHASEKVMISTDNDWDLELMERFPDAHIRFCNIRTNGFPRPNNLYLYAEEDSFVYKTANGKLMNSGLKWIDEELAWVGKITNSTSYVISNIPLRDVSDSTSNDKKENTASDNTANKPETSEKVKDTVAALKDPAAALPAGITKTTTAGGASISTILVPLTSGSATVGMDLFNTIGNAPANVSVKFSVSAGLTGGSMEVIVPGGFGKITEPGRIGYSMDYSLRAENNDTMLKAVKGENATSTTAKIGGNQILPVTATITVATKSADSTTVNIYKYDPHTKKFIVVGKAVAKDGKLTFGTNIMGEMLFTTGTV